MAITIKQREATNVTFYVTSTASTPVDISTASYIFKVQDKRAGSTIYRKTSTDFDATSSTAGYIIMNINSSESNQTIGSYKSELQITYTTSNIQKTTFEYIVQEGLI